MAYVGKQGIIKLKKGQNCLVFRTTSLIDNIVVSTIPSVGEKRKIKETGEREVSVCQSGSCASREKEAAKRSRVCDLVVRVALTTFAHARKKIKRKKKREREGRGEEWESL